MDRVQAGLAPSRDPDGSLSPEPAPRLSPLFGAEASGQACP